MCIPHPQTNSSIAFATILSGVFGTNHTHRCVILLLTCMHGHTSNRGYTSDFTSLMITVTTYYTYTLREKRLDHCIILPQMMTDGQY